MVLGRHVSAVLDMTFFDTFSIPYNSFYVTQWHF